MRSIPAGFAAALGSDHLRLVVLAELMFDGGPIRVHTGVGTYTVDGNAYLGVGALGTVDKTTESFELQAYGIRLTLTGVPNSYIALARLENYQGRTCRLYLGALDSGHQLIVESGNPYLFFSGRMDNCAISVGESKSTVTINVENRLVDWDRARIRRYNNADQQAEFPGDKGMEFAEQMVNKTLYWGRKPTV